MTALAQALLLLDTEDRIDEMVRYVQEGGHQPGDMVQAIHQLLVSKALRPAYLMGMLLANAGYGNPIISVAVAAGGLLFGNAEEEARGLTALRFQTDALTEAQRAELYSAVLEPAAKFLLEGTLRVSDHQRMLRILEILKAGAPRFRTIFDSEAPIPALTLDELRRQGRARSRLISHASPPASAPRSPRRAVVAFRELFFPNHPGSRPLDLGPRLVAAMEGYGWRPRFYGMPCRNLIEEYRSIAELCVAHEAELLVLDDNLMEAEYARPARAAMIARLRQELPDLKIVSILFDTWSLDPVVMTEALAGVDCVWETTSPSLPLWREPAFAGRVLHMQVPHAGNDAGPGAPLDGRLCFCGGVKGYNWHRAFWLAAAAELGLPVEQRLSSHQSDGLPALESYALYMRQIRNAPCSLNLSMRSDLSCIVTGRSFETIISGSLLVQEATPDMDYYFTAGEHYLSFETLAELVAVVRFLAEHRDEAEEVRRCGNAFARERYSDDRLVGYLDKRLFFPD